MCASFNEIPAKGLQDIKKTKCYGRTETWTDGRVNSIPPLKLRFAGGIKNAADNQLPAEIHAVNNQLHNCAIQRELFTFFVIISQTTFLKKKKKEENKKKYTERHLKP